MTIRINATLPGEREKQLLLALAADIDASSYGRPNISALLAELAMLYDMAGSELVELIQVAQGVAAGGDLDDWFVTQQWRAAQERHTDARYWYMLDGAAVDGIWLPGTAQNLAGAMAEAAMLYECECDGCPADMQIIVAMRHNDKYQHRATRPAATGGAWSVLPK